MSRLPLVDGRKSAPWSRLGRRRGASGVACGIGWAGLAQLVGHGRSGW